MPLMKHRTPAITELAAPFLIVALSACSSAPAVRPVSDDDLLVKDSFEFRIPDSLSPHQAREDIALLLYAIQNGYGGRKFVPAKDLERALTDLKGLPRNASAISPTNFCRGISRILTNLPDNHLSARLDGEDCNEASEEKYVGSVGKNIAKSTALPWETNYRLIGKRRIPVISITSFPKHEDRAWNGFLAAVLDAKRTAPALIIDFRGNGGGDDTMGINMASYLYGQDVPSPIEAVITSQTPATFALAANNMKLRILRARAKGKAYPDYFDARLEKQLTFYRQAINKEIPAETLEPGTSGSPFDPKKAFTKPIFILIDRACQSSCESTLEAFESHPFAVTIGENTGGFIHFGNMGHVALPHSKIVVQLATQYSKRKDGKLLEKVGYAPKIRVPAGKDALEVALNELQKHLAREQ